MNAGTANPKAQIKMDVQNRGIRPIISNSEKSTSTIQIINIFIAKLNRPRVKRRKGRVARLIRGLRKKLTNPRTAPTSNKSCQVPLKITPSINRFASHIPAMPITIWMSKRLMRFIFIAYCNVRSKFRPANALTCF